MDLESRPGAFTEEQIRDYWAHQAESQGLSPAASWTDQRVIELEIAEIGRYLEPGMRVLDAGCGNGYSSVAHALRDEVSVLGVDYVESMVESARQRLDSLPRDVADRLDFCVDDVRALRLLDARFDCVISTRVIINLASWDDQQRALREYLRVLRPGGLLLLSEATVGGWRRLNMLRREWGLPDIPMPPFNNYLDEDRVIQLLEPEASLVTLSNFASTYYAVTRVLKPLLVRATGADVDVANPEAEINRWAAQLSPAGDYGTQKLFVFRRLPT